MGNKIPFNKIHNFIVYEIIDENGNLLNNFDLPLLEWAKVNNYSYTSLDKLRKGNLDIQLPYKNWKLKKLYVKRKHFQRDDSYLYILFDLTKPGNYEYNGTNLIMNLFMLVVVHIIEYLIIIKRI